MPVQDTGKIFPRRATATSLFMYTYFYRKNKSAVLVHSSSARLCGTHRATSVVRAELNFSFEGCLFTLVRAVVTGLLLEFSSLGTKITGGIKGRGKEERACAHGNAQRVFVAGLAVGPETRSSMWQI